MILKYKMLVPGSHKNRLHRRSRARWYKHSAGEIAWLDVFSAPRVIPPTVVWIVIVVDRNAICDDDLRLRRLQRSDRKTDLSLSAFAIEAFVSQTC